MTVKKLKELLENIPDNYIVTYEYDGPETIKDIEAVSIYVSNERELITFIGENEVK